MNPDEMALAYMIIASLILLFIAALLNPSAFKQYRSVTNPPAQSPNPFVRKADSLEHNHRTERYI